MSSISAITYDDAVGVTVSDTNGDPNVGNNGYFAGLQVWATGTIKVTTANGTVLTFPGSSAVPYTIPVRTQRVWSTGTTVPSPSTNILGLIAAP